MLALALIAATAAAGAARAQSYDELPPELDQRAQRLYGAIMCPQCAGQSIDQSNAPVARAMRQAIREQLRDGAGDDEIIDLLVTAYGEEILASPPTRGFSLAAWAVPPAALLLGGAAVALAVRSLRRRPGASAEPAATGDAGLEPYLDIVDREMANDSPGARGGGHG